MNWFIHLSWWQWVLIVALNSFLGYWAGVGTLYCWHCLKLMEWPEDWSKHRQRMIIASFVLWPGATVEKLAGSMWWEPPSMDGIKPNTYLAIMIVFGLVMKIAVTVFMYVMNGFLLWFQAAKEFISVPKFIKKE